MNRIYLALFVLLLAVGCTKKLGTTRVPEQFDEFYERFHEDLAFQKSRVKFPLEGEYVGPEGAKDWKPESWEMHRQKVTDITDPNYDTEIIRRDQEVIDKVQLRDAGLSIERKFQRLDGKWYLVYYKTVDL